MSNEELLVERERLLAMLYEAAEIIVRTPPDRYHEQYEVMEARISRFLKSCDEYLGETS